MCGFYDDEQKIKKGDRAVYQNQNITITSCTHIKENKTMNITYIIDDNPSPIELLLNLPYKTTGYDLTLLNRN